MGKVHIQSKEKKPLPIKKRIKGWFKVFNKLNTSENITLLLLLTMLIALPLAVILAGSQTYFRLKAKVPATPPVTPSSPTPTNNMPEFITQSLPDAVFNKNYNQKIEGFDPDQQNSLTLNASDLPQGLELTRCKSTGKYPNNITCNLVGKPQDIGSFSIILTLEDSDGNTTTKDLLLNITQ